MIWFYIGMSYAIAAIPFFVALLVALFGCWGVIAASYRVTAGAWIVAAAFLVETAFVTAPYLRTGINLNSNDLAFGALLVALLARVLVLDRSKHQRVYWLWLAFGGGIFISLFLGLAKYGSAAGVDARPNFYFWMAGLYFATFRYPPEVLQKLWRITQWCGWLVAVIVVYRWLGLKYGFVSERLVEYAGASNEFRVVGSSPAFFIAMTGVAYFALWLRHARVAMLAQALFMLGLVLVLQHRSVWVSMIGALGVVAWHQRKIMLDKIFQIAVVGILMAGVLSIALVLNPSNRLEESIIASTVSVTESHGTHVDRIEGWKVLLAEFAHSNPRVWLIGNSYGTGYERYVLGKKLEFSPHNFYVQLLLRTGIAGLLLFLWVHLALRRQVRSSMLAGSAPTTLQALWLALLAANLLYYIPYQGFYMQGAFCGVLIGYLAGLQPAFERGSAFTKQAENGIPNGGHAIQHGKSAVAERSV